MPSCNTYRLTWVFLTMGVGYLFSCFSKVQPLLLTLDEGYLLTAALPDLQRGIASLGPSAPVMTSFHNHRKLVNLITLGPQPCLTQLN